MQLTNSDEVAKERLSAILSDKLLRFNPYSVSDEALLDSLGRGYWRPLPSLTQMVIFHFQDIQLTHTNNAAYYGLFFNVGNDPDSRHYSIGTFTRPMTHPVSNQQVWMTINGKHLTPATINRLTNRDVFVSHAINCRKISDKTYLSYRMHLMPKSPHAQAKMIRESMIISKLTMLEEVMQYPTHPDYLAYTGLSFDFRTPILSAIANIRQFPNSTPPSIHQISQKLNP